MAHTGGEGGGCMVHSAPHVSILMCEVGVVALKAKLWQAFCRTGGGGGLSLSDNRRV